MPSFSNAVWSFLWRCNAGALVEGTDMKELVKQFIDKIIAVASGEEARNERNGYREISIFKNGVTL
jgi:altronate hydrolase